MKKRNWYDYLWIWSLLYFALGLFNILFAWLGLIDFIVPLAIAAVRGNKAFCNRYCGRGQLFSLIPQVFKRNSIRLAPAWKNIGRYLSSEALYAV